MGIASISGLGTDADYYTRVFECTYIRCVVSRVVCESVSVVSGGIGVREMWGFGVWVGSGFGGEKDRRCKGHYTLLDDL